MSSGVSGDGADRAVADLIERIAAKLRTRFAEVSEEMTAEIMVMIGELDDAEMMSLLRASVDGNIDTILNVLRNSIPVEHVRPSTAAMEYALRLAQRKVSGDALRRAYHIGSEVLRGWIFDELTAQDAPMDIKLNAHYRLEGFIYEYIDAITQAVLDAHGRESRRVADSKASRVIELLGSVLSGGDVARADFEAGTGYPLSPRHRGAIVWISDPLPGIDHTGTLQTLVEGLRELFGKRRLFSTVDRQTAWVWFENESGRLPDQHRLAEVLTLSPGCRVAFGAAHSGIAGFRETHRQAVAARHVALISARTEVNAVCYETPGVAIGALLAGDVVRLRGWIREQLGGLADDSQATERLRETMRVFIECDRSHTRTGAQLNLHRNTVKYRVEKATELLGRTDGAQEPGGTGDVGMALTLCSVFGTTVLQ